MPFTGQIKLEHHERSSCGLIFENPQRNVCNESNMLVLTQNVNTYNLCVAVSASGLEFCLPLRARSVPIESVLHLRLPALLLEDVLLLELVLLLGHHPRQFEEQPHILNIIS